MKRKYFLPLVVLFLAYSLSSNSQSVRLEKKIKPVGFDISKQLIDIPIRPLGYIDRTWKDKVVPNKDGFQEEFNQIASWAGPDPVLQDKLFKSALAATIAKNFAGMSNTSGVAPPDTDGDVSANYFMQMVNLSLQIWDKNGNSLYGPTPSSTLWDGFIGPWSTTNDGDPIVLYDQYADRWIASQFSLPNYPSGPFYELVAVSTTNNPTGSWYRYAYEFANMPDYPKFGVWPDGYYFTINQFAPPSLSFAGAGVCVLNRSAMISGSPTAQMLFFNLGTAYGSLLPADADGGTQPPAGSPNFLAALGTNSLRIWKASIDWANTSNSSVSLIQTLTTQSFSYSGITINQPGTTQTLDPLASRLMYRLQYRNFGSYQVLLTNHTVNANGAGQAGVRWYELRSTGSAWSIYQQGTYAPADGNNRWMASIAMNGNGDIGLGYSVSGSSTFPSIRIAGQTKANSGTGVLDVPEVTVIAGTASQTGVNRWGDYSMMAIDPADDATFWYTTEYSSGGWNWRTRIASFNFPAPVVTPPVANFSGNPTNLMAGQQVTFSDLSTNNPTSWSWSFPGGTPSTSTLKNPVVTYSTAGTFNVTLTATNSAGSTTMTKSGYITVTPYTASYCNSSGSNTNSEYINSISFGSFTKTSGNNNGYGNFLTPSITAESGKSYTFTGAPGFSGRSRAETWRIWIDYNMDKDFDDAGELVFSANLQKTSVSGSIVIPSGLSGDTRMRISMKYNATPTSCENFVYGEVEDYTLSIIPPVAASYCSSHSTSNALDWITNVTIGTFAKSSGASQYSDFTSSVVPLVSGTTNTFTLTPQSSIQRQYWRIWIDYNGDSDFEDAGELVFNATNKKGLVTGSFIVPSTVSGQTRMRVSLKDGASPTSCEVFTDGEVEDYTVAFSAPLVMAKEVTNLNLELYPNPARETLNLVVASDEANVNIKVYNALGQIIKDFSMTEKRTSLDLSGYQTGIYYVGADDGKANTLKKFIKE